MAPSKRRSVKQSAPKTTPKKGTSNKVIAKKAPSERKAAPKKASAEKPTPKTAAVEVIKKADSPKFAETISWDEGNRPTLKIITDCSCGDCCPLSPRGKQLPGAADIDMFDNAMVTVSPEGIEFPPEIPPRDNRPEWSSPSYLITPRLPSLPPFLPIDPMNMCNCGICCPPVSSSEKLSFIADIDMYDESGDMQAELGLPSWGHRPECNSLLCPGCDRLYWPECTSPSCPITIPHSIGFYQHEGIVRVDAGPFPGSNPPPEIWDAYFRMMRYEASEDDKRMLWGFHSHHVKSEPYPWSWCELE